jgi:predicted lactoylglutathione lyase
MLHHISLPVANIEKSSVLYDAALSALGYKRICYAKDFVGYGIEDGKDQFAIKKIEPLISSGPGFHLAFHAPSRDAVDLFHAVAFENGATSNGEPGLREQYGPNFYAAFIMDVDGHRFEAVINESREI